MSEPVSSSKADEWDREYDLACQELHGQLLGKQGYSCAIIIENWEIKYRNNPRIGNACRHHATGLKMTLAKNPGGIMNIQQGDDGNIQIGNSNVSGTTGNVAAGDRNVIQDASSKVEVSTKPTGPSSKDYSNIIAGIIAGVLAAWWVCPDWMSLGPTRLIVTVGLVVASAVMGLLSWFQFRRRNWEKFAYISLGAVLILRSLIPTINWLLFGSAEASQEGVSANGAWYLSFADEPIWASIQAVSGVVLLLFAFLTKPAE